APVSCVSMLAAVDGVHAAAASTTQYDSLEQRFALPRCAVSSRLVAMRSVVPQHLLIAHVLLPRKVRRVMIVMHDLPRPSGERDEIRARLDHRRDPTCVLVDRRHTRRRMWGWRGSAGCDSDAVRTKRAHAIQPAARGPSDRAR